MFDQYPKKRSVLVGKYAELYKTHFNENRQGATRATTLSSKLESWMHRQVASDVMGFEPKLKTLEIGAGGLNQVPYEPYLGHYDIVEPYQDLLKDNPYMEKVKNFYNDVMDISNQQQYDRIISIAVLEHLTELPHIVAKCGLLLNDSGTFRSGVPNEGTCLWKLGYSLTTGVEFRLRHKLDYEVIMRHEHVNTADEIDKVLNYFFEDVKCRVLGLSKTFAFYRFYDCRRPNKEKCANFIELNQVRFVK